MGLAQSSEATTCEPFRGSPLFSVEWNSGQPEGQKRIAQRFIAGSGSTRGSESRRDDRNHALLRPGPAGVLSSLRDFLATGSGPSDESLGYLRPSLRDDRRAAPISGLSVGGVKPPALFHRKQRGTRSGKSGEPFLKGKSLTVQGHASHSLRIARAAARSGERS